MSALVHTCGDIERSQVEACAACDDNRILHYFLEGRIGPISTVITIPAAEDIKEGSMVALDVEGRAINVRNGKG